MKTRKIAEPAASRRDEITLLQASLEIAQRWIPTAATGVLLLGAAVTGCGGTETAPQTAVAAEPMAIEATTLEESLAPRTHAATGTLHGRNTATLTSRVMGHVRTLEVAPGDRVEAGQVLATLDDATARASLRQASASRQEAAAAHGQFEQQVEATQASLELAQATRERMANLLSEGAVTQQQYDEAHARYQGALAQHAAATAGIARANSRIAQARAAADMARTNLNYAQVRAPYAGTVLQRPANVGDLMAPGAPLFVLEGEGPLRAEVAVPESLAQAISLGDEVRLEVDAAGANVVGRIDEIVPAVDARSRAFVAKVALPEVREDLRRGMFVRAHFALGERSSLRIPAVAVSPRGALDRVFVLEGDAARLRLVSLGERSLVDGQEMVEVLSGLQSGEALILTPAGLTDRQGVVRR